MASSGESAPRYELAGTVRLIELGVEKRDMRLLGRALRQTAPVRRTLRAAELRAAVGKWATATPYAEQLQGWLDEIEAAQPEEVKEAGSEEAAAAGGEGEAAAAAVPMDVEGEEAAEESEEDAAEAAAKAAKAAEQAVKARADAAKAEAERRLRRGVPEKTDLPEVEVYLHYLVTRLLLSVEAVDSAAAAAALLVERAASWNRRTMDGLLARSWSMLALLEERGGRMSALRPRLLAAHRTAAVRHDEMGQATLLNLLLRSYLADNLTEQAQKLVAKTTFPEGASNNQTVRHLFYLARMHAVSMDYPTAYAKATQAVRKAPTATALGFRIAANKLAITVNLLMGEIPERSLFNAPQLRRPLLPYLQIAQAVRVGDLKAFNSTLEREGNGFHADKTYTLILRLRHNVIKAGLRKMNTSYSRISFADLAERLHLDSAEDAEYVAAKAIRDGVIDAVIDHKAAFLQSKELLDIYATTEPQAAFSKRISFCLDVRNEAVKAMVYPPKKRDKDDAEERLAREAAIEELAKEIAEEMEEDDEDGVE